MANKENMRKWIEALRSGKYAQTTGSLRRDNGYCCLGIACLAAGMTPRAGRFGGAVYFLPKKAQKWLGISEGNPKLVGERASVLNDNDRLSFPEIADLIEETYLK
jgi:hypothetical protein